MLSMVGLRRAAPAVRWLKQPRVPLRYLKDPPAPPPPRPSWDGKQIVRFGPNDPIDRLREWQAMSPETRRDWEKLGWTYENWKTGYPPKPWSESCDWGELSTVGGQARARRRATGFIEDIQGSPRRRRRRGPRPR